MVCFTTLFTFTGIANGIYPQEALTLGSDADVYSVVNQGGWDFSGAAFRLTFDGQYTSLYDFLSAQVDDFPEGQYPDTPLLEYAPGQFAGGTSQGGTCGSTGCGTLFAVSSSGEFQQIYDFPNGATSPRVGPGNFLAMAGGAVYGVTGDGPTAYDGGGAIYEISSDQTYSTVHIFKPSTEGTGPDGLTLGSDGRLYTSTFSGGANGTGTIVAYAPGALTVLHSFSGTTTDGWNPTSPPIQASDGSFYGTAANGGAYYNGAIYKLAFDPPLPAPVQLTLSSTSVEVGQSVQLSWLVANGSSVTMQQCYAFVQNNASGAGAWTGRRKGPLFRKCLRRIGNTSPNSYGYFPPMHSHVAGLNPASLHCM